MIRLLNANFARMFKGKLFWICAAASVLLGLLEIIPNKKGDEFLLIPENYLFNLSGFFLLIIMSVLVGVFVGAEHGGVLRNKIIVGQKRITVYFTDLFTCCVGVLIIHILFVGTLLLTGFLCGGEFRLTAYEIISYELLRLTSLLSMCAFFTALTMLIPKKFVGAIAALMMIFVFFFISNSIPGRLFEIERKVEGGGGISTADIAEKEFLTVLQDTLPFGQHDQMRTCIHRLISIKECELVGKSHDIEVTYPIEIAQKSAIAFALTTAVGVLIFRRKDIK